MNMNVIIYDDYNNMIHWQIHVLGLLILEKIAWDHVWELGMKVNDELCENWGIMEKNTCQSINIFMQSIVCTYLW